MVLAIPIVTPAERKRQEAQPAGTNGVRADTNGGPMVYVLYLISFMYKCLLFPFKYFDMLYSLT